MSKICSYFYRNNVEYHFVKNKQHCSITMCWLTSFTNHFRIAAGADLIQYHSFQTISKVFEKLLYQRLLSFVNTHNILYAFQFGFRALHSPGIALILLVDKISTALEEGDFVLGLFLDFSKAFDTVNHDILFKKLEYYGIHGTTLDLFKSYLRNRYQYVELESLTHIPALFRPLENSRHC